MYGESKFIRSNNKERKRLIQVIINLKRRDRSVSIQIAHYNHFKEKADQNNQNFIKICIARLAILLLTSKVCFSEPTSNKDVWVEPLIFQISTLM